jgi:hypothetical protein
LADEDIFEQGSLFGDPSEGIQPIGGSFNPSRTRAIWEFENGTMVQGEQSWFLFLYSNNGPALGDFEVRAQDNDDISVPGVPEPTTLALLGFGTVLSLRRRK